MGSTLLALFLVLPSRMRLGWPLRRTLAVTLYKNIHYVKTRVRLVLAPPTGEAVRAYSKAKSFPYDAVELDCGSSTPTATLHRMQVASDGGEKSKRALLFFHGGGYVFPISAAGHIPFAVECAHARGAGDVFVLEYTLAPELKYPGHLVQAVAALQHLLGEYAAEDITMGGDSAGGNLALAVMAHIIKPSPYAPPISGIGGASKAELGVLYLVSPWVRNTFTARSYTTNSPYDIINLGSMHFVTPLWEPAKEIWAEPVEAGATFWSKLPARRTAILTGDLEVFHDDDLEMAKCLGAVDVKKDKDARVVLLIGKNEVHVQSALDVGGGSGILGSSAALLEWMRGA